MAQLSTFGQSASRVIPMDNSNWDLHYAALRGDASIVRSLLAEGHDPHLFDDTGFTALHHAASQGH